MQEKQTIAVFVDYDNIEIGVKSTLRRDFSVAATLNALRERGDIVAKFAYANWSRQQTATRQMAENAVQMVQRNPSPRGDKNGGDINLALDALEMAFTHDHVNSFAIISGDSDFNPLVNKLKEYGKTVYVVGGKAFTSTILQQNCHEFIAYESLISDRPARQRVPKEQKDQKGQKDQKDQKDQKEAKDQKETKGQKEPKSQKPERRRAKTLDIAQAVPLVERTLQVLERRGVQPQLGLMKSTMLQLDSRFSEKTFGSSSFSDFVEKLREGGYVNISGKGGEATIGSQSSPGPEHAAIEPDDALPFLRDVLETHRLDIEEGCLADDLTAWVSEEAPDFDWNDYGFQEFVELLNFAQDKGVVRIEPDEEEGLRVFLGSEFYPPALPEVVEEPKPARKRTSRKRTSSRQSTRRPRETPAK